MTMREILAQNGYSSMDKVAELQKLAEEKIAEELIQYEIEKTAAEIIEEFLPALVDEAYAFATEKVAHQIENGAFLYDDDNDYSVNDIVSAILEQMK